jgi:lipopolysaccharide/colanic/teichoic acid biosynthesis glycosyltransferase
MVKRVFDIVVSTVAIAGLMPLMLALAFLISLTDGRPVLFRQARCGRNSIIFNILKFRTMRPTAEGTILLTAAGDARITRLGAILRHTKLDELPQFFNVFAGQMSIVGPRPEVPQFVAEWPEKDRQMILSVRPGLTDPATLLLLDEEDVLAASTNPSETYVQEIVPRKLALYRTYVETMTFSGDVKLIAQTSLLVLRRLAGLLWR